MTHTATAAQPATLANGTRVLLHTDEKCPAVHGTITSSMKSPLKGGGIDYVIRTDKPQRGMTETCAPAECFTVTAHAHTARRTVGPDGIDTITITDAQGVEVAADGIVASDDEQDYTDALAFMGYPHAVWADQSL